jgi:hypothetical protein
LRYIPVTDKRDDWPRLVAEQINSLARRSIGSGSLTTKTASYTAVSTDEAIMVDASGGPVTITLPSAGGNAGKLYKIKKIDTTGGAVTIDGSGAETIDGSATAVITTPYVSLAVQCDGTEWWIV